MIFTIHTTCRHIEGAGLHNEYYEDDIPCDRYIDIEIHDEQVHSDIAEIVYETYIRDGMLTKKVSKEVRQQLIDRLKLLFDDLDIWDKLEEDYHYDLQEKYEAKYGRD